MCKMLSRVALIRSIVLSLRVMWSCFVCFFSHNAMSRYFMIESVIICRIVRRCLDFTCCDLRLYFIMIRDVLICHRLF